MASSSDAGMTGAKRTRRELSEVQKKEARQREIKRLQQTPIKKWPLHEYSKFRTRYQYNKPREAGVHPNFHIFLQQMIYDQCYVGTAHRVAPMHTINMDYMEENATYFAEAQAVCQRLGLIDLMKFNHAYSEEVICQFISTVHFGTDDARTLTWMTEGKVLYGTWAQFAECLGYPILDADAEGFFRIHLSDKPIEKELLAPLYMPGRVVYGDTKYLQPLYDILNRIFREILCPKVGCQSQVFGFLQNLLLRTHETLDTELQLDVMDFLWNELWHNMLSRKAAPVFAPYLMKFICARWTYMEFGDLTDEVYTKEHKIRKLLIKTHPSPPSSPRARAKGKGKKTGQGSAAAKKTPAARAPMDPPAPGWFARVEAKLLKIFCLKSDMHQRQYEEYKDRKKIMQKLQIDDSEEAVLPQNQWLSQHMISVDDFQQLGVPGASGMPGASSRQPMLEESDEESDEESEEEFEPEDSEEE